MKKILHKISQAVQLIMLAPVKLPVKVLTIFKYVALGLGIIETVLDKDESDSETESEDVGKEA